MAASKVFFTQFEKDLVLTLVKPHLDIVEDKETNAVSCQRKKEVFDEITRQFNDTEGVDHLRTSQQIRQCYLNLKKKLKKENGVLHQERRPAGGGEIPKGADVKMIFLGEPMLKLPRSISFDSDITKTEISESEENFTTTSTTEPVIHPIIISHASSVKDMDALCDPSSMKSNNSEESVKAKTPQPSSSKLFTKFRKTPMMIRKHSKKPSSLSAAARAAACIEIEHWTTIQNMKNEEKRKEQRAQAEHAEHELRMELLREQINLTKKKAQLHEKLLTNLEEHPDSVSFKKHTNLLE